MAYTTQTWNRLRAGYYTATMPGDVIQVEYLEEIDGYGDKGWFSWVGNERSDYPVPTLREAKQRALRRYYDRRAAQR